MTAAHEVAQGDVPIARRKQLASTSVFLTSPEYTSDPTIAQKGTLLPSSWERAKARAVWMSAQPSRPPRSLSPAEHPIATFPISPPLSRRPLMPLQFGGPLTHLTSPRRSHHQQRPPRMSPHLQQLQMQPQRLARLALPYETLLVHGRAVICETEPFDVRMRRDAGFARRDWSRRLCYYRVGHFVCVRLG